jgi:DtxR family Mn-dependent transcriptional regulator
MSDAVERRVVHILGNPTQSPYGNPIPGLAELAEDSGDGLGRQPNSTTPLPTCSSRPPTDQARADASVRRVRQSVRARAT